jgi:hypothetical protein
MHEYWNLSLHKNNFLFISFFFSHFVKNIYFHGNVGTYIIGGAPPNILVKGDLSKYT